MGFTRDDAFATLHAVGAPARLVQHARLVGEAGEQVLAEIARLGVTVDVDLVRAGVVLHDVGKSVHPEELDGPGSGHEAAGEALLLARGVDPRIARICRTHAAWDGRECTLEDLVVALADKLWKGVRHASLEERVVEAVAARLGRSRWDVFVALDDAFERIAAGGGDRLERSRRA
jgi:putative nucleotidyltransferase with HDIG domain